MTDITIGARSRLIHRVSEAELATNFGGHARVFASPALIGAIERACMEATDEKLSSEFRTVGVSFHIEHKAPTPEGWEIIIEAELVAIDRRMLTYSVVASDKGGEIATGHHVRCIVDVARFDDKLRTRTSTSGHREIEVATGGAE